MAAIIVAASVRTDLIARDEGGPTLASTSCHAAIASWHSGRMPVADVTASARLAARPSASSSAPAWGYVSTITGDVSVSAPELSAAAIPDATRPARAVLRDASIRHQLVMPSRAARMLMRAADARGLDSSPSQ